MEQTMNKVWDDTIEELMELDEYKRKHFALMIMRLAQCYKQNNTVMAIVLVHDSNDNELATFSVGADEYEAAQMLQTACDVVVGTASIGAPAKEMMN
jgi:hypothetical protein